MKKRDSKGRFITTTRTEKNCLNCRKKFTTLYASFCCKKCYACFRKGKFMGEKSHKWKGGRIIDSKDGYVLIYAREHPFCRKRDGYVLEHRLVCEKILGRYLSKDEIPHHINENKADNRPENLYLFPNKSEHTRYHLLVKSGKANLITASNLI